MYLLSVHLFLFRIFRRFFVVVLEGGSGLLSLFLLLWCC